MKFNFFKTSATRDLIEKQLITRQMVHRALLRHLNATPIWLDDNFETYIHEGYQFNPDVYSVINQITKAASAVPFVVQRVVNEDAARKYYRLKYSQRNTSGEGFVKKAKLLKEEAFEEAPDSDLARLLDRPNPIQAFPEWIENVLGFKLITGNSYIHGVELTDRRFGELWILPPQFTRIHADESLEALVDSYSFTLFGSQERIPADEVLHIKYWNPDFDVNGSHLYGQSPMRVLRKILVNSNDASVAWSKSFKNMGASGMLFPDDPEVKELTEEQQNSLQKFFNLRAGGAKNFKSALVTSVKMGWKSFGMSPVDLALIDSMKESRRIICNVYNGFPMILMNDSDSTTYNNVVEARKRLYLDIVIPELELLYSELNRWLVPRYGSEFHIDYDVSGIDALTPDMHKKAQWLKESDWLTPNEKRAEMTFESYKDASFDEPWVGLNTVPLSEALTPTVIPENSDDDEGGRTEEEFMEGV